MTVKLFNRPVTKTLFPSEAASGPLKPILERGAKLLDGETPTCIYEVDGGHVVEGTEHVALIAETGEVQLARKRAVYEAGNYGSDGGPDVDPDDSDDEEDGEDDTDDEEGDEEDDDAEEACADDDEEDDEDMDEAALGKPVVQALANAIAGTSLPRAQKATVAEALSGQLSGMFDGFNEKRFVRMALAGVEEGVALVEAVQLTRKHYAAIGGCLADIDLSTAYKREVVGAIASALEGTGDMFNRAMFIKAAGLAPSAVETPDDDTEEPGEDESLEINYCEEGVQLVTESGRMVARVVCDTESHVDSARGIHALIEYAGAVGYSLVAPDARNLDEGDMDESEILALEWDAVDDLRADLALFMEQCEGDELDRHRTTLAAIDAAVNEGDFELAEELAEPLLEYKRMSAGARRSRIRSLRVGRPKSVASGSVSRADHRRQLMKRRRMYRTSAGARAKAKRYARRYQRYRARLRPMSSAKSESIEPRGRGPQKRESAPGDTGLTATDEAGDKLGVLAGEVMTYLINRPRTDAAQLQDQFRVSPSCAAAIMGIAAQALAANEAGSKGYDGYVEQIGKALAADSAFESEGEHRRPFARALAEGDREEMLRRAKAGEFTGAKTWQSYGPTDHVAYIGRQAIAAADTTAKLKALLKRADLDFSDFKKVGGIAVVESDVAKGHQTKIALATLKMHSIGARIMGGMSHGQAVQFLVKDAGYSLDKVKGLLTKAGHSDADIEKFVADSEKDESEKPKYGAKGFQDHSYECREVYTSFKDCTLPAGHKGPHKMGGKPKDDKKDEAVDEAVPSWKGADAVYSRAYKVLAAMGGSGHATAPTKRRGKIVASGTASEDMRKLIDALNAGDEEEIKGLLLQYRDRFPAAFESEETAPWVFISWTDEPVGNARIEHHAVVWKKRATAADIASARKHAAKQNDGRVHFGTSKTTLDEIRAAQAAGKTIATGNPPKDESYRDAIRHRSRGWTDAGSDGTRLTNSKPLQEPRTSPTTLVTEGYIKKGSHVVAKDDGTKGVVTSSPTMKYNAHLGDDAEHCMVKWSNGHTSQTLVDDLKLDEARPDSDYSPNADALNDLCAALYTGAFKAAKLRASGKINDALRGERASEALIRKAKQMGDLEGRIAEYVEALGQEDAMGEKPRTYDDVWADVVNAFDDEEGFNFAESLDEAHGKALLGKLYSGDPDADVECAHCDTKRAKATTACENCGSRKTKDREDSEDESIDEGAFSLPPSNSTHTIRDPKSYGHPDATYIEVPAYTLKKATIFMPGGFGWFKREVNDLVLWTGKFAQYENALHVQFREKGKRKTVANAYGYNPRIVVFDGWGIDLEVEDAFEPEQPSSVPGVMVRKGKRASQDPGWNVEMGKRVADYKGKKPVIAVTEGDDTAVLDPWTSIDEDEGEPDKPKFAPGDLVILKGNARKRYLILGNDRFGNPHGHTLTGTERGSQLRGAIPAGYSLTKVGSAADAKFSGAMAGKLRAKAIEMLAAMKKSSDYYPVVYDGELPQVGEAVDPLDDIPSMPDKSKFVKLERDLEDAMTNAVFNDTRLGKGFERFYKFAGAMMRAGHAATPKDASFEVDYTSLRDALRTGGTIDALFTGSKSDARTIAKAMMAEAWGGVEESDGKPAIGDPFVLLFKYAKPEAQWAIVAHRRAPSADYYWSKKGKWVLQNDFGDAGNPPDNAMTFDSRKAGEAALPKAQAAWKRDVTESAGHRVHEGASGYTELDANGDAVKTLIDAGIKSIENTPQWKSPDTVKHRVVGKMATAITRKRKGDKQTLMLDLSMHGGGKFSVTIGADEKQGTWSYRGGFAVGECIVEAKDIPDIDSEVYRNAEKPPKYNAKVTPLSAHGSDGGKMLARRLPGWTKQDHLQAAAEHERLAAKLDDEWKDTANKAAQATFGRPYQMTDYRISGIASDKFSNEHKDALRKAAHGASARRDAAHAHRAAAKMRSVPKANESLDEGGSTAAFSRWLDSLQGGEEVVEIRKVPSNVKTPGNGRYVAVAFNGVNVYAGNSGTCATRQEAESEAKKLAKKYGYEFDASADESLDEVTIAKYEVQQRRSDTPVESHMHTSKLPEAKAKALALSKTDGTNAAFVMDGEKVVAGYYRGKPYDIKSGKTTDESRSADSLLDTLRANHSLVKGKLLSGEGLKAATSAMAAMRAALEKMGYKVVERDGDFYAEKGSANESEETARKHGIQNPNSSGQGSHPDHAKHPYHDTLTKHGYKYSHSTPVGNADGEFTVNHTYKKGDHNVGVQRGEFGHTWWAHAGGSARYTKGGKAEQLDKYLKGRKTNESDESATPDATLDEYVDLLNGTYFHADRGILTREKLIEEGVLDEGGRYGSDMPDDEEDGDDECEATAAEEAVGISYADYRAMDEAKRKSKKGYWRTTKRGHRIFIENGKITKGNPHVIKHTRKS